MNKRMVFWTFPLLLLLFTSKANAGTWITVTEKPSIIMIPQVTEKPDSGNVLKAISATLKDELALRSGPGTKYTELGIYPIETEIVVYEQEMGGTVSWGMVELRLSKGLCRAYTGMKRISARKTVPWANTEAVTASVNMDVLPRTGPGSQYTECKKKLKAGSEILIYHEEQDYVMADFKLPGETLWTRGWIPVDMVDGYQPQ